MLIRLLKAHTHGGREYPPGAELDLSADQAQWLKGLKVAEDAPTSAATPVTPAAAPRPKNKE